MAMAMAVAEGIRTGAPSIAWPDEFLAHLDTVLELANRIRCSAAVPAASSSSVSLRGHAFRLDSCGGTPPELAGEDARAAISAREGKNSVQMRPAAFVFRFLR